MSNINSQEHMAKQTAAPHRGRRTLLAVIGGALGLALVAAVIWSLWGRQPTGAPPVEPDDVVLYYNLSQQQYVRATETGFSTRLADDTDGTYHIEFAANGRTVTLRTADRRVLTEADSRDVMGLTMDDNHNISAVQDISDITGGILYYEFYVTALDGSHVTANYSVSGKGYEVEFDIPTGCKMYNVSTESVMRGGEDRLYVTDRITVIARKDGTIGWIYIVKREAGVESDHIHCLCGGHAADVGDHVCDETVRFSPWNDSTSLPTTAGRYYLNTDVVTQGQTSIAANADIVLCLNGHTVTAPAGRRVYALFNEGCSLTITDCQEETGTLKASGLTDQGGVVWLRYGTFNLFAGTLDGSEVTPKNFNGATVNLNDDQNTVFNMYGGTVLGGSVPAGKNGGAIYVTSGSVFNMYGGTVSGGRAETGSGGNIAVAAGGIAKLLGGTVKDGFAQTGGNLSVVAKGELYLDGVQVSGGSTHSVEKNGSWSGGHGGNISCSGSLTIAGNTLIQNGKTSSNGMGMGGGNLSVFGNDAVLNMTGGVVQGGSSKADGGNLTVFYAPNGGAGPQLNLRGGTISGGVSSKNGGNIYLSSGTIHLSGTVLTGGKTDAGTGGNVYVGQKCTVEQTGGTIKNGAAYVGGNLYVEKKASVVCSGGVISGGTAYPRESKDDAGAISYSGGHGGNIATAGTLTISGGAVISGGTALANAPGGGNISLVGDDAILTMAGGTVTGGTAAKRGGNILALSGANAITVSGGRITKGRAESGGGIDCASATTLRISGGTITENVSAANGAVALRGNGMKALISGGTVISGNFSEAGENANLYVGQTAVVTADRFTAQARIGVTLESGALIGAGDKTGEMAIISDSSTESVRYMSDGNLYLVSSSITDDLSIPHSHCVCGDDSCAFSDHAHAAIQWTPWLSTDTLPTNSGNYFLTCDVILKTQQSVTVENAQINVCLNGHTVTGAENNRAYLLGAAGVTLTVTDCAETAGTIAVRGNRTDDCHGIQINSSGTLNLYRITLDASAASSKSGVALRIGSSASTNMYSGNVVGGTAANEGGALYVGGKFAMYGGTITGGDAASSGGNVKLVSGSTTVITGGEISGGSINGDTARTVSNIQMVGGTLTVSGGVLGGLNVNNSGGLAAPMVTLSNTAQITSAGGALNFASNVMAANVLFEHLSDGAQIHVVRNNTDTFAMAATDFDADDLAYLHSVNAAYKIAVAEKDGDKCLYFYQPVAVTGITLSSAALNIVPGDTAALTATITPANATNQTVSWSSDNEAVATVDDTGVVTGVALGTATVTATTEDGGKSAICVITVKEATVPVTGVTLDHETLTIATGTNSTLTPTVTPADATDSSVSWSSSDLSVATVDENGQVTAVSEGTATITVTTLDGGKTASCTLTVVHSHCVCGDGICEVPGHSHTALSWQAWDSSTSLPTTAGNYYLTHDITLSGQQTISTANAAVTLCLNGHTVTGANGQRAYLLNAAGVKLTITDCAAQAGTISVRGTRSDGCVGIQVNNSGTLTLYRITLDASHATATGGGGIAIRGGGSAAVNLYNATVIGGNIGSGASVNGGAVFVQKTLNLYGGEIRGGTARQGGNVYVDSNAVFTMTGGAVRNGTCTDAGGNIRLNGTMVMSGGEISGGSVSGDGTRTVANIQMVGASASLNITGGTISGGLNVNNSGGKTTAMVTISGTAQIGSTASGLNFAGNVNAGNVVFGNLEEGAEIYVARNNKDTFATANGMELADAIYIKSIGSTYGISTDGSTVFFTALVPLAKTAILNRLR